LLERALAKPGYRPGKIAVSGVTDCLQPVERELELTRGCLGVMAERVGLPSSLRSSRQTHFARFAPTEMPPTPSASRFQTLLRCASVGIASHPENASPRSRASRERGLADRVIRRRFLGFSLFHWHLCGSS
jgi:hypothetical protein